MLATGLFGYIPEYGRVIKAASQALVPGGHLTILDGKQPESPFDPEARAAIRGS